MIRRRHRVAGGAAVQRAEDQVAGLGGGERRGGRDRLAVAHLADSEDDVRIGAERPAQRLGEAVEIQALLHLPHEAPPVRMPELDRILEGQDDAALAAVEMVDRRRQGGGLPRAGGAGDENQAPGAGERRLAKGGRHARALQASGSGWEYAGGCSRRRPRRNRSAGGRTPRRTAKAASVPGPDRERGSRAPPWRGPGGAAPRSRRLVEAPEIAADADPAGLAAAELPVGGARRQTGVEFAEEVGGISGAGEGRGFHAADG